jgi:flagellar hook-basal body complex protein FliE
VSVTPISFLPPVTGALPVQDAAAAAATQPATSFADLVTRGIADVNQQLLGSQADLRGLALGGTQSLHETMIHLEQTRIAFQLMVQVRNRLLESYQDVMRMQV